MAWNEPGNSGRDPWGGGNRNDQGPPDLDEVVKKLQQGLNGLFGKSGGGSGGGDPAVRGHRLAQRRRGGHLCDDAVAGADGGWAQAAGLSCLEDDAHHPGEQPVPDVGAGDH